MEAARTPRRRALAAALIVAMGLVAFVVGMTSSVSGAEDSGQHLGNCPADASVKVDPPGNVVEGSLPDGVTVTFSTDWTDVTVTTPDGVSGTLYIYGGIDKLVGPFTVPAGATTTFSDALTGPQEQPQQISHVCLGFGTTVTTAGATTTTSEAPTTTTAAASPTTVTTAAVLGAVETTTTAAEQPVVEPSQLAFTGAGERMLWLAVAGLGLMLAGASLQLSQRHRPVIRRTGR